MQTKLRKSSDGSGALIVIIGLLVAVLVGATAYTVRNHYGHVKTTTKLSAKPALVTISRSNPLYQPGTASFAASVTDTRARDTLLHDVRQLTPVQTGAMSCPEYDGVSYELYFTAQKLTVSADATGCQLVKLSDSHEIYRATLDFWKDISNATGQPIDPNSKTQYF